MLKKMKVVKIEGELTSNVAQVVNAEFGPALPLVVNPCHVMPMPAHETPEHGPKLSTTQSLNSGTKSDQTNQFVLSSNHGCDAALDGPNALEQPVMDEIGNNQPLVL